MSVARRLLAAVGTGALTLIAVAPPASAQAGLTFTGAEGNVPTFTKTTSMDGKDTLSLEGTISSDDPIARVDFTFNPALDDDSPTGCAGELLTPLGEVFTPDEDELGGAFKFEFTSPCNRSYDLKATIIHEEPLLLPPPEPANVEGHFTVAVPPGRVKGLEETYDPRTREVRLTWAANSEADLLGYFVERSPQGGEFIRTGELVPPGPPGERPSYTDPDISEKQRYRIVAVRRGATAGSTIVGEVSLPQSSGPDAPEPTISDAPDRDTPAPGARREANRSTTGRGESSRGGTGSPSRVRQPDNVFEEALPFDPSQTTTIPATPDVPEDAAVLTELGSDASELEQRRATFVPVAGGLALIVGAMHLLLLSKRAGEPDIPIVRR